MESNTNMLESHTPESIIKIFKELSDCTNEICELIKICEYNDIRKLKQIFLSIENYDMNYIYELTRSKIRSYRYNSTYLVLSKIKIHCKRRVGFEMIEDMYNNVFCVRVRDVCPLIRSMCIDFICGWVIENKILFKMCYMKYIIWGLEDRSELVRRKALKSVFRIFEFYKPIEECEINVSKRRKQVKKNVRNSKENHNNIEKHNNEKYDDAVKNNDDEYKCNDNEIELCVSKNKKIIERRKIDKQLIDEFYEGCWKKIVSLAMDETGGSMVKVAEHVVLYMFSNLGYFKEEDVLCVLGKESCVDALRKDVLNILCPDGVWNLERMHELLKKSNTRVFRNFCANSEDIEMLVMSINDFLRNKSSCCSNNYLCVFEILREQDLSVNPGIFIETMEITKDSIENTAKLFECIANVKTFKEHGEDTRKLLDKLEKKVYIHFELAERFITILKNVRNDFHDYVEEIIERLKNKITQDFDFSETVFLPLIREFDVTDILCINSKSVIKAYAALWCIFNQKYHIVEEIFFRDADHFLDLTEFLILFYTHGELSNEELKENLEIFKNIKLDDDVISGNSDKCKNITNKPENSNKKIINEFTTDIIKDSITNNTITNAFVNDNNNEHNRNLDDNNNVVTTDIIKDSITNNTITNAFVNDNNIEHNRNLDDNNNVDMYNISFTNLCNNSDIEIKNRQIDYINIKISSIDKVSSFKNLFYKLYILLINNPKFFSEKDCLQLYKLNNLGLFTEYTHIIFETCSDHVISLMINNSNSITHLLHGFLKAVIANKNLVFFSKQFVQKAIKLKFSLFSILKNYISQDFLANNILIHFIPALSVNECIALESLSDQSKFKDACLRKIKSKAREKVTVI